MTAVTGGAPKELLALGSSTVLARIIDEARDVGVDGVVVVNSRGKPQVDEAVWEWSRTLFPDIPLRVEYQEEAKGLGHAVVSAGIEDDVLVMAGDVVYRGGSPSQRMVNLIHRAIDGCVAVEAVEEYQMHLYGIVELDDFNGSVTRIVEKPSPAESDSRWAVAGRWAFSKRTMNLLRDYCADPNRLSTAKEINLTEFINLAIGQGLEFKAVALQPGQERVDCGSVAEYQAARRLSWE